MKHRANGAGWSKRKPILKFLASHPSRTMAEIAAQFPDIGLPTLRYHMSQLVMQGHCLMSGFPCVGRKKAATYSASPAQADYYKTGKMTFSGELSKGEEHFVALALNTKAAGQGGYLANQ